MLHSQYVSNGNEALFRGGWIGVEFFFVLSGFLMARYESSLKPILGKEDRAYDLTRIASDTFRFIRRKIARLFPYFVFALIVNYVIWNIPFSGFSSRFVERGISGLLNFMFAYSAGFRNSDFFYLGYSWYVSAMIIAMWLLFPLLRRNRKMFNYVYAPVIAIMGMGLFAFKYGNLGYVSSDDWVLSNGVLRALCSISLGAISFEFCTQFERIQFI